jgi:hypothetical protein
MAPAARLPGATAGHAVDLAQGRSGPRLRWPPGPWYPHSMRLTSLASHPVGRPPRRRLVRGLRAVAGVAALLLPSCSGGDCRFQIQGECGSNGDCAANEVCVGLVLATFCAQGCSSTDDCPSGMVCGPAFPASNSFARHRSQRGPTRGAVEVVAPGREAAERGALAVLVEHRRRTAEMMVPWAMAGPTEPMAVSAQPDPWARPLSRSHQDDPTPTSPTDPRVG